MDHIKCKFCNYKTPRWITKNGKKKHGYSRLKTHLELNHFDIYLKVKNDAKLAILERSEVI